MSYGRYASAVKSEMAAIAADAQLDVDARHRHVLAKGGSWPVLLWPPLREIALDFMPSSFWHSKIHYLQSSQRFALNLLGPLSLDAEWARRLWEPYFPCVERVIFEWPRSGDALNEKTRVKTQIDARVDHAGNTTLVEVKLTEADFGSCRAARNEKNDTRATSCDAPFTSLQRLGEFCYLSRRIGRDYFVRLQRSTTQISEAGLVDHGAAACPLRGGFYQIVRNLMMAQHVYETENRQTGVAIIVPGPDLHPHLHQNLSAPLQAHLGSILKPERRDVLREIRFEEVVSRALELGPLAVSWAEFMQKWYVQPLRTAAAACGLDPMLDEG